MDGCHASGEMTTVGSNFRWEMFTFWLPLVYLTWGLDRFARPAVSSVVTFDSHTHCLAFLGGVCFRAYWVVSLPFRYHDVCNTFNASDRSVKSSPPRQPRELRQPRLQDLMEDTSEGCMLNIFYGFIDVWLFCHFHIFWCIARRSDEKATRNSGLDHVIRLVYWCGRRVRNIKKSNYWFWTQVGYLQIKKAVWDHRSSSGIL